MQIECGMVKCENWAVPTMNYFVPNVLNFVLVCVVVLCPIGCLNLGGDTNNDKSLTTVAVSTKYDGVKGATQRRLAINNATTRNRDTQLLSLLAARRRQIMQSRLHSHLAAIEELVETTTQLNHLLGIVPAKNISRIYIDIRNIRNSQRNAAKPAATGGATTPPPGNATTILSNLNKAATNKTLPSGRVIAMSYTNAKENVSQLVQNSSKLFQTNDFLLNIRSNGSLDRKSQPDRQFKNELNRIATKYIYKSPKTSEGFRTDKSIVANITTNDNDVKTMGNVSRNTTTKRRIEKLNTHPFSSTSKRLPIDLEQISYDTLGLAERKRLKDDDIDPLESEDSLQVQESNHDLFLLNYVGKNTTIKHKREHVDDQNSTTEDSNASPSSISPVKIEIKNNLTKSENETVENPKEKVNSTSAIDKHINNTLFMSESLYNHFRPLETNLPEDEIQPFLYFGQKLASTVKPSIARHSKVNMHRHQSRFNPDSSAHKRNTDNSESSLMDLSVERQNNIANKVLNIRNLNPTRRSESVREYFRPRNDSSPIDQLNITRPTPNGPTRANSTELPEILTMPRKNNQRATTVSTGNETETSSEVPHPETVTKRHRQYFIRNPHNRTYFILQKRNMLRQSIIRPHLSNASSDLAISDSKSPILGAVVFSNNTNLRTLKSAALRMNETESTPRQNETQNLQISLIPIKTDIPISMNRSNTSEAITSTSVSPPVLTTQILSTKVVTSVSVKSNNHTSAVNNSELITTAEIPVIPKQSTSAPNHTATTKFQIIVPDVEISTLSMIENSTLEEIITTETPPVNKTEEIVTKAPTTTRLPRTTERHPEITTVTPPRRNYTIRNRTRPTIRSYTPMPTKITSKPSTTLETTTILPTTQELYTSKVEIITLIPKTSPTTPLQESTVKTSIKPPVQNINVNLYTKITEHPPTPKATSTQEPSTTALPVVTKPKSTNGSTPATIILRQNNGHYQDSNLAAYILAVLGIFPCVVIVGVFIKNLLKRRIKLLDSEADILAENGPEKEKHTAINPVARLPMIVTDANSKWEFPRAKLRLKTLLGEGNFGQVWKAEADDLKGHDGLTRLVAVKTIKDGAGTKEREDLHRELSIMQKIGSHPNVVQLLGCCTEKEPYLLIMEYVMYGKLLTYLRDHRTRRDYYNFSDDAATLTSRDLTVFAYCVARGMEYLNSKGIIHRDLAARNILVDHNKLCKISDFGLSRYTQTGEVKEPRQPKNALPVRWMASEALMYSLFTEKSDVWSFGILLWEIVTLGATPYATMSGREVMHCVCEGYRLERPSHCKPELYRVMARTWASDRHQRPSFADLRHELAELLENNSMDYSYVDLESFAADSNIYEITNINSRGNYCTIQSRISEFECDI